MPSSNVLLDRLRGLADPALRRRTMARALDGDPDQIARAASATRSARRCTSPRAPAAPTPSPGC